MTRAAALVLTVVTGFSGLVYEVSWQKYLATLLGSHSEATAAVLAIFLGGLSAGYALFGRATKRLVASAERNRKPLRLLRFYAGVEGSIGIYALAFPVLFGIAQAVSLLVPAGYSGFGFAFDVVLSALLIGPPSILMGGTIPILTLALTHNVEESTRVHALVYGVNTAGAFVGALAAAFWLIPGLGLDGACFAMGIVNIAAATGFALLDRFGERIASGVVAASAVLRAESGESPREGSAASRPGGFAGLALVAMLAGFAMMSIQAVLNRVGALAFGSSHFTFAMVVAVFVLSIALGSFAVSTLSRISPVAIVGSQWLLVYLLSLLYRFVPDSTYYAHVLRTLMQSVESAFYPYYYLVFTAMFALLVIPIGLSGALLPMLFHHMRGRVGDLGAVAGKLYSWNTIGSLLGALLGGYILLYWLDLDDIYQLALAALVVNIAILTPLLLRSGGLMVFGLILLPSLFFVWNLPAWDAARLSAGIFRERAAIPVTYDGADAFFARHPQKIIFHDDGPNATATVRQGPIEPGKLNLSIITNGKSDGHLVVDYATMGLCGLVPAFLAEKPERAFVIGFGTGVSAGELAKLDSIREVKIAEISNSVMKAAPFFAKGNLDVLASPKVTVYQSDAYRALLRDNGRYDVIVSEPSNPWVAGVEMLYSLEFLRAARQRLAPGGVYAQWFHLYELNDEIIELVLRTYSAAFPYVSVWYTSGPDILLVGFDRIDRALDVEAMQSRFAQADFTAGFARVGIGSVPALLAHELAPVGVFDAELFRGGVLAGELHTLRHPRLSHLAVRAFFVNSAGKIPHVLIPDRAAAARRNSLLARLNGDGPMSEENLEASARETCRLTRVGECLTFLARWTFDYPDSPRLARTLAEIRATSPFVERAIQGDTLERIAKLYDPAVHREQPDLTLEQAKQATARFISLYHAAVPFEQAALATIWGACRSSDCTPERERVERQVGSFQ